MLSHLGPYQILAPLGAGGMGEVYRARDPRLDREVAIKILPAELSRDAERLRRFEQEARAAGTLSHPNVLTVFDIGNHEGAPYLVTELLEGETLRQHLAGGRLPARRALDIAGQVARGLAAAHAKGVVHRDLKPENLFLSPDGRVKILDFGLAKLTQAATSGSQVAEAKTVTGGTEPGTLLGTIGYMAPEQVRGQAVDHRADIFALGAILFEMLSGGRAFHGPTSADTLGAILREDPPELSRSNPALSPALDAVLRHCLEKEPARRVQSAHDLILELELVAGLSSSAFAPGSSIPNSRQWRARAPWLAIGLIAGGAMGILAMSWWARRNQAPAPVTHFQIAPPEGANFNSEDAPVTLSPDGRRLVYRAEGGNLTVRDLGAAEGRELPGTDGAYDPFWSADGQWLGYFVASQMMRIEPGGSVPRPLTTVNDGRGASWNHSGTILFSGEPRSGLSRVAAGGGSVQAVTTLDSSRHELGHWRPHFLPDGRHFLYLIQSRDPDSAGIYAGDLESPLKKRISPAVASPQYTAGWLLFLDRNTLFAQPFDAGRLELAGEPRVVAERVLSQPRYGSAAFSVAATGTLAYQQTIIESVWQPTWYDRQGKPGATVGQAGDTNLDLSPDGSKLAAQAQDPATGATDIWLIDLERGVRSRFTFDPQDEAGPVWSGDAQHIAYVVDAAEGAAIVRKPVNGAGPPRELLRAPYRLEPIDWSLDGRYLLYEADPPGGRIDLLAVEADAAGGPPIAVAATPFVEHTARFSPDGRWIAYVSDESGREEIYAQPFPPSGAKWQISASGGDSPRWRADGRELYFVEDGSLQAVDVDGSGPALVLGPARTLFATRSIVYEPAPDGRFLVATRVGGAAPITVILNWRDELPREH